MVRNRKSIRKIASFTHDTMKTAVLNVVNNGWSVRAAAIQANIIHMTLKRYVDKYKALSEEERVNFRFTPNYEINQVFSKELEDQLRDYLIIACKMHHGLTRKNVMQFAYELAVKNNLKFPNSWNENKQAGVDWLYGYMKRYSQLSIRKPEATSLSRATSFNKTNINEFFDNLVSAFKKFRNGPSPENIYNLDETALTTVHNPPNVVGPKGLKQIGQVTSGERGVLVTVCCFINAIGNSVPPFLVFPRVHFKDRMLKGAPPGSAGAAVKTGWVNGEVFIDILRHLHHFTKSSSESPILLILDNHESHITIASLEFCKSNGIILLTLPPHTSGKLQPLDKALYKSLKTHFNKACNDWMITNPGKTITIYEIAELLGKAYPLAFIPNNIISGFKSTGIWPLNRQIFSEDDFLASAVTDRPFPVEQMTNETATLPIKQVVTETPDMAPQLVNNETAEIKTHQIPEIMPVATASFQLPSCSAISSEVPSTSSWLSSLVSPEQVRPFPRAEDRKEGRGKNRKRKSQILTNTPIKDALIADLKVRHEKNATRKRGEINTSKKCGKTKMSVLHKRIQKQTSASEDEESPNKDENDRKRKEVVKRNVFQSNTRKLQDMEDSSDSEKSEESFSCADSESSMGSFISHDEEISQMDYDDNKEINVGDYVLIKEGISKGIEILSIGHIIGKTETTVKVTYIRRLFPKFTFISSNENYVFNVSQVVLKLPTPKPSGQTARRSEMLVFPVDFQNYYNVLK